tara:strand:+ start:3739 stop:4035 length:297 start_codon:yes stop_codon:yes gene_type:complete
MVSILEEAIQSQSRLSIQYTLGNRMIEPHTLGRGKDGQLLLRAYQVSGASASGEAEGWKLMRVARIGGEPSIEGSFASPRDGYKRGDSVMVGGIIAQL